MMWAGNSNDTDARFKQEAHAWMWVWAGQLDETRPLNGGSDTRVDQREHALLNAAKIGVPARAIGGHTVITGWSQQPTSMRCLRGHRYVRRSNHQFWMHWRKEKRERRLGRLGAECRP